MATTMTVGGDVDDGTTRGRGAGSGTGRPRAGRGARARREDARRRKPALESLSGRRRGGLTATARRGRAPPPRRTREGNKKVRSGRDAPCASSHAIVSATTRGTPPHPSLHASRRGAPNTGIVHGSSGVREGTVRARASVPNRVRREKRFGGKTRRVHSVSCEFFLSSARKRDGRVEERLSFRQRWRRAARASPRVPSRSAPACSTGTGLDASFPLPAPPPTTRRPPSRSMWCCTATRGFPGRTHLATARRLRGPSPREAARRAASAR